mgnify:CR=1 FL=1
MFDLIIISILALSLRKLAINKFKISYYEQKLKNRNVDISNVEDIGIIEILKSK